MRAASGKCGERTRLENFPEIAELGGRSEPILTVVMPQAGTALISNRDRGGAMDTSYYAQESCRRQPAGLYSLMCAVRLGRVWLVSSWNTRWICMTPVKTERRFSFWQLLVASAERGASRQVAQAGDSCFGQGRDLVLSLAAPGGDVVRVPSSKSHKHMGAPDSNLQHNSCNNNNISFNIYSPLRPLATCETLGWLLWKSSLINAVAFCVIYYISILILQMWKLRHRLWNLSKMMEPYFKLRLVWFWRQLISWLTFWMPYNAYHIIQWWVCP